MQMRKDILLGKKTKFNPNYVIELSYEGLKL